MRPKSWSNDAHFIVGVTVSGAHWDMVTRPIAFLAVCLLTAAACSSNSETEIALPGGGNGGAAGASGAAGKGGKAGSAGTSGASGKGGGIDVGKGGGAGSGDVDCTPETRCKELGKDCGAVTDAACGGVIQCGSCKGDDICGGGGVPSVCATGQAACVPKTCADQGFNCGVASDGCGKTLDCGATCANNEVCGANGVPNVCGAGTCTPKTCADIGLSCGPAGDGCGNPLNCGDCATGTCGGGGVPGECGQPTCKPQTCADQGITCGVAADGCGGTVPCGSCSSPQICGGGGEPGKCGCTGVCADVPTCTAGKTTSLTGKVFDPAGKNPLYNVLVYVPNTKATLPPFEQGLTCDQCGAVAAGEPLVTTHTAPDGSFKLDGVPVGSDVPVVIQLGRWRRQVKVPITKACGTNTVATGTLRMPRKKSEGDIPRIGLLSATVDGLECVLRKIGLDDSEFGNPGDASDPRVQFFRSDLVGKDGSTSYGEGAVINGSTPNQSSLFAQSGGKAKLQSYDMVMLPCPGLPSAKDDAQEDALRDYANAGGRIFSTHYSYPWLTKRITPTLSDPTDGPFESVATWTPQDKPFASINDATVDTVSNPRGADFREWLKVVGALKANNTLTITEARRDSSKVNAPTQRWIAAPSQADFPLHFTFNTPLGAPDAAQCGRVLFSDFHVANAYNYGKTFPKECADGDLTAQEKILEFMIFDLGSCVEPYKPVCTKLTCEGQGIECGAAGDGCGGALECGTCTTGICGGVSPGKCGLPECKPRTCADQGIECGAAGDGCGKPLDCGTCTTGICGGGGKPGVCGNATCTPQTCSQQGIQCGPAGNGCGAPIACGDCPPGLVCGLNEPGKCGAPACKPLTCADQNVQCGPAGDGCGNKIECGTCQAGQICGFLKPGECAKPVQLAPAVGLLVARGPGWRSFRCLTIFATGLFAGVRRKRGARGRRSGRAFGGR
jgi:hypothetical protein